MWKTQTPRKSPFQSVFSNCTNYIHKGCEIQKDNSLNVGTVNGCKGPFCLHPVALSAYEITKLSFYGLCLLPQTTCVLVVLPYHYITMLWCTLATVWYGKV